MILLIGLAVGVDYSLFYLRREREERGGAARRCPRGRRSHSGRAVPHLGVTVLIAMAGMFLSGDKTFMSFSIGTMMVVAVAMIGSLTVLPALLSKLGDRVDKGRIPFLHRLRRKDGESRFWGAILDRASFAARSSRPSPPRPVLLVALAVPAFTLNTARPGSTTSRSPRSSPLKKLDEAFPGGNEPAVVAIKADDVPPGTGAAGDRRPRARRRSPPVR